MKNIVVAGGGLVGCLIAIMMKKRGHRVTILEKRTDIRHQNRDGGRSINLIVTSRGLNALEKAGLLDRVFKITVPVTGRMIHGKSGELVYQPYGRDPSECNYSVSRAELNRLLLNACDRDGIEILFDTAVESIDFKYKNIRYAIAGASRAGTYDILLATDGASSTLRKEIKKARPNEFLERTDLLSSDYKELFMPLGADGKPVFARNALHIWPRQTHMLMALPNLDGSFTMTLYMPKHGSTASFDALKTREQVHEFLRAEFPDALDRMPQALDDYFNNAQGWLGTVRAAPWIFEDSVALLGDAAHAIVPFFGQGMNLGFEDCVHLDDFLTKNNGDWARSLSAYDTLQRPNANAMAEMALENFIEMRDKVGDPKFMLMKKIEARLEAALPTIYRSRYGMITYTLIPYSLAREAGIIQERILQHLSAGIQSIEELNIEEAKDFAEKEFLPFLKTYGLSVEKYRPAQSL